MSFYTDVLRPLLFQLDPEDAHNLVTFLAPFWPDYSKGMPKYAKHECSMFGQPLRNPIGLGAGFDKQGKLTEYIHKLGFGWSEMGSVTYSQCKGNPRPRMFRYPETETLINRMGLSSDGVRDIALRYAPKMIGKCKIPIGINIAKSNVPNADLVQDITETVKVFSKAAALYTAINISCPNSAEGPIDDRKHIDSLLSALKQIRVGPMVLKLSPDSPEDFNKYVVKKSDDYDYHGFICGNTTTTRKDDFLTDSHAKVDEWMQTVLTVGGMSGKMLKEKNISLTKLVNKFKAPNQIIIGCGGISTVGDIEEYYSAGATFFQIYSALVFKGPDLVPSLVKEMKKNG